MNWILIISYWLHLLTTVVWLGGLVIVSLLSIPTWLQKSFADSHWFALQMRLTPYVNGSMVVLWISGFYQMTVDEQYTGFLSINSTWAIAILLKHVAVVFMTAIGLYSQFRILPEVERLELLRKTKPHVAEGELGTVLAAERRLLRINLACAVTVLFFTALATAT